MNEADRPRFFAAVAALGATLDKEVTEVLLGAYWAALQDIEITVLEAACFDLSRSAKFFPKPVEIRELTHQSASSGADEAWAEVLGLLKNCRNASHDDLVVERVVRQMGGWVHLGSEITAADLNSWKAKEFRRMYAEAKEAENKPTRARLNQHPAGQIDDGETQSVVKELSEKMTW